MPEISIHPEWPEFDSKIWIGLLLFIFLLLMVFSSYFREYSLSHFLESCIYTIFFADVIKIFRFNKYYDHILEKYRFIINKFYYNQPDILNKLKHIDQEIFISIIFFSVALLIWLTSGIDLFTDRFCLLISLLFVGIIVKYFIWEIISKRVGYIRFSFENSNTPAIKDCNIINSTPDVGPR